MTRALVVSAFAATSEAYFSALSNIGENALRTVSSRPLGEYGLAAMTRRKHASLQDVSAFMVIY